MLCPSFLYIEHGLLDIPEVQHWTRSGARGLGSTSSASHAAGFPQPCILPTNVPAIKSKARVAKFPWRFHAAVTTLTSMELLLIYTTASERRIRLVLFEKLLCRGRASDDNWLS